MGIFLSNHMIVLFQKKIRHFYIIILLIWLMIMAAVFLLWKSIEWKKNNKFSNIEFSNFSFKYFKKLYNSFSSDWKASLNFVDLIVCKISGKSGLSDGSFDQHFSKKIWISWSGDISKYNKLSSLMNLKKPLKNSIFSSSLMMMSETQKRYFNIINKG